MESMDAPDPREATRARPAAGMPRAAGPGVVVLPPGGFLVRGLEVAGALAAWLSVDVHVLRPLTVPPQTPLDHSRAAVRAHERVVEACLQHLHGAGLQAKGAVKLGHEAEASLSSTVRELEASFVVVPPEPAEGGLGIHWPSKLERTLARLPCPAILCSEPEVPMEAERVIVAVAGGPHTPAAAWVGQAVASSWQIPLHLLHILEEEATSENLDAARALLRETAAGIRAGASLDLVASMDQSLPDALLDHADTDAVLVLGAPSRSRLARLLRGTAAGTVQQRAGSLTLAVHSGSSKA